MKSLFFICIVFLLPGHGHAQNISSARKLNPGDKLSQVIPMADSAGQAVSVKVPGGSAQLFYRYRWNNGFTDSPDSLLQVEKIAENLQKNAGLRDLKVICYAYNGDNSLAGALPRFRSGTPFQSQCFYLNDLRINMANLVNHYNGKLVLLSSSGHVLSTSAHIEGFSYVKKESISRQLKAKLLTEKNGVQTPLAGALVYIPSPSKTDTLSSAKTNKYGDFELSLPGHIEAPDLQVEPADKNVSNVILATQEGVVLSRMKKSPQGTGFQYKIIPAQVVRLTELPMEEDISLVFKEFVKTGKKELKKDENIVYDVGSYKIDGRSKQILDKVVAIMVENPRVRLEVISHTDSQGDDASNLELSEKRSIEVVTYLILVGVDKSRLKPIGRGETELRNRCRNGVDCSDTEHRYNRRTEFRFIRS